MKKQIKILALVSGVLVSGATIAQDKKGNNLGTEVVDVVRRYDATVSDAFKVREVPNFDEEVSGKKKPVVYTISSFPVASTFVPAKGEAAKVETKNNLQRFDNYALLGIGNYSNINAELFLSTAIDKDSYISGFLTNFSSNGGIKDLQLKDGFSKTHLGVNYSGQKKNIGWNTEIGGSFQTVNWYGLPTDFVEIPNTIADSIDALQKFKSFYVDGSVTFKDAFIKSADVYYSNFSDDFNRKENRFSIKPKAEMMFADGLLGKLNVVLDYVGSNFDNYQFNYAFNNHQDPEIVVLNQKDNNFIVGAEPSVVFKGDDYNIQVGVGLFYNSGKIGNQSNNSFKFYPQVKASYTLVQNIAVAYAGIDGNLKQNSYQDFVRVNPFVAPDIQVLPTDKTYDFYVGMKGKLDHTISYNIKASYRKENDLPLFVSTGYLPNALHIPYRYGNSFSALYDEVETVNVFGELRFDILSSVSLGLRGEYNGYTTDKAKEAWGLPAIKIGADALIDFNSQWFSRLDFQYIGERKDMFSTLTTTDNKIDFVEKVRDLDGIVDFNLMIGYRPTKNWTVFVKGNNLFNQDYQQWGNFKSQGIQVMGGAMYKFDF